MNQSTPDGAITRGAGARKYVDVLAPFAAMMEKELHANSDKGDRSGWLAMTADECMLEIYYHAAKLQKAVRKSEGDAIGEHAADVANMAMMLADVCGALSLPSATMDDLKVAVDNVKDVLARMERTHGTYPDPITPESFQAAWLTNRVWELDKVAKELAADLLRAENAYGSEQMSHADTAGALQLQSREVIRLQGVIHTLKQPWYKRWFK